ncbi:hypothetical protein [Hallella colorans]|uniref:hypothetical protein n=1 Tax=Hallella colorans TaxID=1703337 RepID=UPI00248E4BEF|nr:hypothetical protein [Hallella colorans]
MKRDLRPLMVEVGKKMKREPHRLAIDLDHVAAVLSKHHINLNTASLRKLRDVLTGKRKLSNDTLDRLALLAGFQDWRDLRDAIHGDTDASINYEDDREKR